MRPSIVDAAELPPQYHFGMKCDPRSWVAASSQDDEALKDLDGVMGVKPTSALWTAPVTSSSREGVRTTWSEFHHGYGREAVIRNRESTADRWRRRLSGGEKMWPVQADGARLVRLDSVEDLQAAAQKWPGPHGRISFEAMRTAGIDGVWVKDDAITEWAPWTPEELADPAVQLRFQFYGWDVESVAWLRPDKLVVGRPARVDRGFTPRDVSPWPRSTTSDVERPGASASGSQDASPNRITARADPGPAAAVSASFPAPPAGTRPGPQQEPPQSRLQDRTLGRAANRFSPQLESNR